MRIFMIGILGTGNRKHT